jgi:UDP-N-acetyl-D-mannosaminuronate dehydrogenase
MIFVQIIVNSFESKIGSAGNIGGKTIIFFAERGAKVVVVDINEEGVQNVAQKCRNVSPHHYKVIKSNHII